MSTRELTNQELIEKAEALLDIALDEAVDAQKQLYVSIGILYATIALARNGEPLNVGVVDLDLPQPRKSVIREEMEEIV